MNMDTREIKITVICRNKILESIIEGNIKCNRRHYYANGQIYL